MRFDIEPNVGALPICFGQSKAEVHALLGSPESTTTLWDKSGTAEYWLQSSVIIGYDGDGIAPVQFQVDPGRLSSGSLAQASRSSR